jgi:hypothetical protein
LLPSEHRADLAAAEASLEGQNSPAALLALGKVLLCAGKTKRARDVLSRAEGSAVVRTDVALAGAYRLLSELAEFGACREWAPGNVPLELARRWSDSGWAIERDSWERQLQGLPTAAVQEAWFITQIASLPNELPSASSPDEARSLWARLVRASEQSSAADSRREITLGTRIVELNAMRLVDRRTEAREIATGHAEQCRAADDGLEAGLFSLLVNDLATTSRTVPEVIDLYAGDSAGFPRTTMDLLEEGPLPDLPSDWDTLLQGQSVARTLFEESGWPYGVAAAQVHAATWITRAKPEGADTAALEILQLNEALAGFGRAGDDAGKRLVQCRLIATGVEENFPLEGLTHGAHEIGVWGREVGSLSFALGLGYFLLAAARSWRRRGNLACALRALRLATVVFDELEATVASADAAMEEADILAINWESAQALPSLQRALNKYIEAIVAMGVPEPGFLDAWQRLRRRIAHASAALLSSCGSHESIACTRQRLVDLNIMPGMTA